MQHCTVPYERRKCRNCPLWRPCFGESAVQKEDDVDNARDRKIGATSPTGYAAAPPPRCPAPEGRLKGGGFVAI